MSSKSAGLRRLQITEDTILTPNLLEAEDTDFNSCMPDSSSVISEGKLVDESEHKLEAPLVPNGHPNTNTDDSDSNHILKDQEPETVSTKSNGTDGTDQKEESEGMVHIWLPLSQIL